MGIPQTHQATPHLTYNFHRALTYSFVRTSKYPNVGKKDVHISSVAIQKQDGNTSMLYPDEYNHLGTL